MREATRNVDAPPCFKMVLQAIEGNPALAIQTLPNNLVVSHSALCYRVEKDTTRVEYRAQKQNPWYTQLRLGHASIDLRSVAKTISSAFPSNFLVFCAELSVKVHSGSRDKK